MRGVVEEKDGGKIKTRTLHQKRAGRGTQNRSTHQPVSRPLKDKLTETIERTVQPPQEVAV